MAAERFDFVVAGSGAGGSAVAARLTEGGAKVLLAEKGGRARPAADAAEAIGRYYTNAGLSAAAGNCLLPIPTGGVLGGTTKINSGTCLRPPAEMLARWERSVRNGGAFSAGRFERYLEAAWRRLKAKPVAEANLSASTRLFLRGLKSLGLPGGGPLDRGEDGCSGEGRCCFVCPQDRKMSADKAFLEPLLTGGPFSGRLRLEVALETELMEADPLGAGKVRAVLRRRDGSYREVDCGAVVLACGALRTPFYARDGFLGPGARGAGDGLSLHPAAKVFALFDEPVRTWRGVPQGGGYVDPGEPRIRYEGVHVPADLAAMTMPLEGRALRRWMDRVDHAASFGFMIRDASRGSVRYPAGPGLPAIRYNMGREDLALMIEGMRFTGKVFFAAGAREVLLPLNRPDNCFTSRASLEAADFSSVEPSHLQLMAFHPLGTCGMGRVVDGDLKLRDGIYVADGSVVPESLGVNPQITIYAFALRLAERLLGR